MSYWSAKWTRGRSSLSGSGSTVRIFCMCLQGLLASRCDLNVPVHPTSVEVQTTRLNHKLIESTDRRDTANDFVHIFKSKNLGHWQHSNIVRSLERRRQIPCARHEDKNIVEIYLYAFLIRVLLWESNQLQIYGSLIPRKRNQITYSMWDWVGPKSVVLKVK